jgi:hypothetical protein
MCRIWFIIHLVPLVHGNIFVCRNFGQNSDKYTHRRQVDMIGRPGAHMPCHLAPPWCRLVPLLPIPHHRSVGEVLQTFSSIDLKSVCTDAHDGVVLDPWVHCHGLGALQPTLELPYWPNIRISCVHIPLLLGDLCSCRKTIQKHKKSSN